MIINHKFEKVGDLNFAPFSSLVLARYQLEEDEIDLYNGGAPN